MFSIKQVLVEFMGSKQARKNLSETMMYHTKCGKDKHAPR